MEKQGKSLACQFEQMMELGDASDKEAPTTNPRKKYLTKSKQFEVISMLVIMANEDCLKEVPSWTLPKGSTWHTGQFTDYGLVLY